MQGSEWESGQSIVGTYRVRAKGYEEWKEPKAIADMHSGTGAEGTYVSAGGECVHKSV